MIQKKPLKHKFLSFHIVEKTLQNCALKYNEVGLDAISTETKINDHVNFEGMQT